MRSVNNRAITTNGKDEMLKNTKNVLKNLNLQKVLFPLACCLLMSLTGCVRYDVGVNFNSPHNGKIVEHIKIGQQLNNLDRSDIRKWLNSIESRAERLQGKVKNPNPEELLITIPFNNGKELTTKFNELFHSIPDSPGIATDAELLKLDSQINLRQNNLVFLERNTLDMIVDLRALNILAHQGKIDVENDRLIDLEFKLNTPWIAYPVLGDDNLQPIPDPTKQLVWHLQPGKINHLKAVFWLPSPIGIGAAVIVLLMNVGFYLKYRRFPGVVSQ